MDCLNYIFSNFSFTTPAIITPTTTIASVVSAAFIIFICLNCLYGQNRPFRNMKLGEKKFAQSGEVLTLQESNPPYMEKNQQTKQNLEQLESWDKSTVPINTAFAKEVAKQLKRYAKAKGLRTEQDVIRLAVGSFLEKAGYLS